MPGEDLERRRERPRDRPSTAGRVSARAAGASTCARASAPIDALHELEAIYAAAPVGLAVFDRDLRFVRVNDRLAEINGLPVQAHVGRTVRDVVPDLSEQAEAVLRRIVDTGEPVRDYEFVGETPAQPGVRRTWVENWVPVRDASGGIVGVSVVAQEVTALRRATEAAQRREHEVARIADNAPVIIARYDRQLRHVFVSKAIETVTGLSVDRYLGRSNRELGMPAHLCDMWDARILAAFGGERQRFDFSFDGPDGLHHYEWTVVPEPDASGRIETVLSIAHDVTVRVRSVEALREAHRRKDEFLATLAHELRNPLAPLRTGLRVVARDALSGPAGQAMAMCTRQLSHMTRLIDDLLEVSRISRGQIELRPEPVMVPAALESVAETMGPTIEERGQRLLIDVPREPFRARVDPIRFTQMIENLLSNASKYTDEGGTVTMHARCDEDRLVVSVSDTGIGIAADDLPRLFDIFSQLDAGVSRARGGLGIGLALVRKLAEAHGGTVTASSDGPGRGATFTVELPRGT